MPTLSWNEIRHKAVEFAAEWADATRERAEQQSFWNDFFEVFGVRRRLVATFEEPVRRTSGTWGFIDLFWPGRVLIEHKAAGANLGKAHAQALDYIRALQDSGRGDEVPRWIIVSDFRRIALHDLEPEPGLDGTMRPSTIEFRLADLHENVRHFAFLAGYRQRRIDPEDPANFAATELMAQLHDDLYDGGYPAHDLPHFLVRLLFCFFADDTGIFTPDTFKLYLEEITRPDGSDLGRALQEVFEVLNTPMQERQRHLDEVLAEFPYVNGDLFAYRLPFAAFNSAMRQSLIRASRFRWDRISPAIFGSLFQTVFEHQDERKRRQIGAHYTTESDILKTLRSLFLDDLRTEVAAAVADRSQRRRARLQQVHHRLAQLRILDPACGCGNFLVVAYREIRALELELLRAQHGVQQFFSEDELFRLTEIDVDQMYGIEIEELPAQIARVALWLVDHLANRQLGDAFGQLFIRLPLRKSPHVLVANALRTDWNALLPKAQASYVVGNPPFIGKKARTVKQQEDMALVFGTGSRTGTLDYVCCWYERAAQYVADTPVRVALVSTNSITQGEQPGIIWPGLFARGMKLHFAHRTFEWTSEARGRAHVHVVILGFGHGDEGIRKSIVDYDADPKNPSVTVVANISPYLIDGRDDDVLQNRRTPLSPIPELRFGSMPNDQGHLLLDDDEKADFLAQEPGARRFVRPLVSAHEFLHGKRRWCLWLEDIDPSELRALPAVMNRVRAVKAYRADSTRAATVRLANTPTLFGEIRRPTGKYVLIPRHSSENRRYIPMAFLPKDQIPSDSCLFLDGATLFHFGVLMSGMHMAWVRTVCGRIKSDFRYSTELVYNNFPWPTAPDARQVQAIQTAAQGVLDARALRPNSTLADLYDPLTTPRELRSAHDTLDRTVDRAYRTDRFAHDRARVEYLFALRHERLAMLAAPAPRGRARGARGVRNPGDAAG